ncbi:MAG: SpoIIE family protein phosphatase [Magnetococcales bacterium]|nr:SpoIIE family protein phosphatase [Magnetococcales bacterium]
MKNRILIVDDEKANIDVLIGLLGQEYKTVIAKGGSQALARARSDTPPDLILLDIMMPEMDGYEVCRQLKADEKTRDIPVIFLTAKSEVEDETKGLGLGAVDYITKPISPPILKERVKNHLALKVAHHKLDQHNQQLLAERQLIEDIILSMRGSDAFDDRNLRYLISPVEKTAGDMLLSTFTPAGRQLVMLGDFTGHGLPAAIGGPLATYILHALAQREISGERILQEINDQLCARLPVGFFLAVTLVDLSPSRREAKLWNSALPDSLLIRKSGELERYPSTLLPLGILNSMDIAGGMQTLSLEEGDRLYSFSDGIVEAMDADEGMFGVDRLIDFLRKSQAQNLPLDDLMKILNQYANTANHEDDITLVEIQP